MTACRAARLGDRGGGRPHPAGSRRFRRRWSNLAGGCRPPATRSNPIPTRLPRSGCPKSSICCALGPPMISGSISTARWSAASRGAWRWPGSSSGPAMDRYPRSSCARRGLGRAGPARQGSAHQHHQFLPRSQGVRTPGGNDHPRVGHESGDGPTAADLDSAGCSTGEETYFARWPCCSANRSSSAAKRRHHRKLQVFASDVDPDAINRARDGLYPASIEAEVSAERLARFFTKELATGPSSSWRSCVVFTVQDVPGRSRRSRASTFVSCRNLLIYLRPEAQAKVLALLHFALREDGDPRCSAAPATVGSLASASS